MNYTGNIAWDLVIINCLRDLFLQIWIFKWISEISESIKESNSWWQKISSDFEK
jgi:hypothetical protein